MGGVSSLGSRRYFTSFMFDNDVKLSRRADFPVADHILTSGLIFSVMLRSVSLFCSTNRRAGNSQLQRGEERGGGNLRRPVVSTCWYLCNDHDYHALLTCSSSVFFNYTSIVNNTCVREITTRFIVQNHTHTASIPLHHLTDTLIKHFNTLS